MLRPRTPTRKYDDYNPDHGRNFGTPVMLNVGARKMVPAKPSTHYLGPPVRRNRGRI